MLSIQAIPPFHLIHYMSVYVTKVVNHTAGETFTVSAVVVGGDNGLITGVVYAEFLPMDCFK